MRHRRTLVAMLFLLPTFGVMAQSSAAMACGPQDMAWAESRVPVPAPGSNIEREGKSVARTVAGLPTSLQPCKITALVVLAVTGDPTSDLDLIRLARRNRAVRCSALRGQTKSQRDRRAVALAALGAVEPSWSVVSSFELDAEDISTSVPEQKAAIEAIYGLITCIDALLAATERDEQLANARQFRGAIELAHANARTGYFPILFTEPVSCEAANGKVAAAAALRAFTNSEFGIKSTFVEASARIVAGSIEGCEDPRAMIDAALLALQETFAEKSFAKSVEGWRWVNDFLYLKAVLQIAKDDLSGAKSTIAELEAAGQVSQGKGAYADNLHPVAAKVLQQIDAERSSSDIYKDQVFVRRPVAGWTRNAPARSNPFISNKDAAAALIAVVDLDRPACANDCSGMFAALDRQLRDALVRQDIRVVAGSYSTQGSARRGLRSICNRLDKGARSCRFGVERFGRYHRISTEPMSDSDAAEIALELEALKLDYFLSRPQVLSPL